MEILTQRRKDHKGKRWRKFFYVILFIVFFVSFAPLCEKRIFQVKRLEMWLTNPFLVMLNLLFSAGNALPYLSVGFINQKSV